MKKCSQCNRVYDDSQAFCLDDGTPLAIEKPTSSQETVVLPRRKNKFPLIFGGLLMLLVGAFVVGWLLLGSSADKANNQNSRQVAVNIQTPTLAPTISPTETPTPLPSPSPTISPETNANVTATNSEIVSNVKPTDESNSAKQSPPNMKSEDHLVLFELKQCRKSGSSITCDFSLTNKGSDRRFQFVIYRSNLYDELGNGYEGKKGQLANQDGNNPRINFVSGVTAKAQITFEGIEPNANKITLLRIQYDVGDDNGLEVKFRNVPLTISK